MQARIEKTENDILELSQNAVNLKSNYLELMELRHVLEKTQIFFTEVTIETEEKDAFVSIFDYFLHKWVVCV